MFTREKLDLIYDQTFLLLGLFGIPIFIITIFIDSGLSWELIYWSVVFIMTTYSYLSNHWVLAYKSEYYLATLLFIFIEAILFIITLFS